MCACMFVSAHDTVFMHDCRSAFMHYCVVFWYVLYFIQSEACTYTETHTQTQTHRHTHRHTDTHTVETTVATHLVRSSKQGSHTRTSFSIPNLGMMVDLDEHLAQKMFPQARQWCYKSTSNTLITPRQTHSSQTRIQANIFGYVNTTYIAKRNTRLNYLLLFNLAIG